jgi:hypothetical protein
MTWVLSVANYSSASWYGIKVASMTTTTKGPKHFGDDAQAFEAIKEKTANSQFQFEGDNKLTKRMKKNGKIEAKTESIQY